MLVLEGVDVSYGRVQALHGLNLHVDDGEIVTLIGCNGAGKSTTLRTISGLLRPRKGGVSFDGASLTHLAPHAIVAMGLSHVPEGRELFSELTVLENLQLGGYSRRRAAVRLDIERIFGYFPILAERRKQPAGSLSGGEQQMLAIGRGLMARPRLLLLDEPSLGLAPLVVREIFRIIQTINREENTTILLVEQNVGLALSIAQYGYVLETGNIVIEATAEELKRDETVRRSYLGY